MQHHEVSTLSNPTLCWHNQIHPNARHMERDNNGPTKTFQHSDTCYIKCARSYFQSQVFPLGLTHSSSPAPLNKSQQLCLPRLLIYSRLQFDYFSSLFQLMLCRADTWLKQLIEGSYGPHEPTFGCVIAKKPEECHRHPKWIPHVVCIISSPNSWPTVQLEIRFTVIRAASLWRSAETICT